ncbi:MAG TPA: hypothetical protein VGM17_02180 [Rhizomicrobium sp.]|jgi:hypothetical protein
MHLAIALTLAFAAATSLLGARRSAGLAAATRKHAYWLSAGVALTMTAWLAYCALWMFGHL